MKKTFKKVIHSRILPEFSLLSIILFSIANFVYGQDCPSGQLCNPLTSRTFAALVENIARIIANVGIPVAAIFIIYSGFLFVTASGNEEKLKKAKEYFFWTIVGAGIIVGANAIATAIVEFAQSL